MWYLWDTGVSLLWMSSGGLRLPLMALQLRGAAANISYL